MSDQRFVSRGILDGHAPFNGAVTSIAAPEAGVPGNNLVSGSRDKTVMLWELNSGNEKEGEYGVAKTSLTGHSNYVEDVVVSKNFQFALSASWDHSLRLWDLNYGSSKRFVGHTGDVLSVAFSACNTKIVSGGRDKSIKLWNTVGNMKCDYADAHGDWVSCVKFSPQQNYPHVISAGWDKVVKIWTLDNSLFQPTGTLVGHTGFINALAVAPDGSLCASGGKDGVAMLWEVNEQTHLYSLEMKDVINALAFSPSDYLLAAGTDSGVVVYNLRGSTKRVVELIGPHENENEEDQFYTLYGTPNPGCTSLAWSHDGTTLYTGWSDGLIRVYSIGGGSVRY